MKAMKVLKYIGMGILAIGFMFAAVFVTQYLWNWLVPELFNGPEITYWQTLGLFILSKILLSGIGAKGHCGCHGKDKKHGSEWRQKFHEKYKGRCGESKVEAAEEV